MEPLISIVIPVFNRAEIFTKSLQSALAQDYTNTEIIVVDDGSLPAISVAHSKVNVIRQPNRGAAAARNRGAKEASGEYLLFWDADLLAKKNFVTSLYLVLKHNPNASYAYSDFKLGNKTMRAQMFNGEALKKTNYISANSLIKKSDFAEFDETLKRFQDWDLWLRLLEQNKTGVYVPEILFTAVPGGTMSAWLPSFAYHAPFKWLPGIRTRVKQYEQARQIILQKHGLL